MLGAQRPQQAQATQAVAKVRLEVLLVVHSTKMDSALCEDCLHAALQANLKHTLSSGQPLDSLPPLSMGSLGSSAGPPHHLSDSSVALCCSPGSDSDSLSHFECTGSGSLVASIMPAEQNTEAPPQPVTRSPCPSPCLLVQPQSAIKPSLKRPSDTANSKAALPALTPARSGGLRLTDAKAPTAARLPAVSSSLRKSRAAPAPAPAPSPAAPKPGPPAKRQRVAASKVKEAVTPVVMPVEPAPAPAACE
jgi:hypothetical protein